MTLYRLIDSKDAKFFRVAPWVFTLSFFLPAPFVFCFVQDRSLAKGLSFLLLLVSAAFLLAAITSYSYYGRFATLEEGVLKIYTPRKREVRAYRLDEMNKAYVYASHGARGGLCHKCLLLCQKGLVLEGYYTDYKGEWLPWVTLYIYSGADRKKMVTIENKELEEKILAYYGEPITEPDSTL